MKYETTTAKSVSLKSDSEMSVDVLCDVMGLDDLSGGSAWQPGATSAHLADLLAFFGQYSGKVRDVSSSTLDSKKFNHVHRVLERSIAMLTPLVKAHESLPLSNNTWLKKGRRSAGSEEQTQGRKQAWAIVAPMGSTLASVLGGDARAVSLLLDQSHFDTHKREKAAVRQLLLKAEKASSIEAEHLSVALAGSVLVNLIWRIAGKPVELGLFKSIRLDDLTKERSNDQDSTEVSSTRYPCRQAVRIVSFHAIKPKQGDSRLSFTGITVSGRPHIEAGPCCCVSTAS